MSEPSFPIQHSVKDSAAARYDVFLSHNSQDKPVIERIAEKLKHAGFEPWLDKWRLIPGNDSPEELAAALQASLACAVFIGPHDIGNWQDLEYKSYLSRAVNDRSIRLFPVLLPGLPEPFAPSMIPTFLSVRTWVDLRKGIDDTRAFQSLINAIKGVPLGPERAIEPRNDICPYRGLQTFDEAHAEYFFGRDGDIQRLVEKLKGTRFLAVLGPSGSGKSSLVRAGLIPALRRGQLPGSDTWPIQLFTPTTHPLQALAGGLSNLGSPTAMGKMADEMESDEREFHLYGMRELAGRPAAERIIFVVDQFEEVFTLCRDDHERAQFLANLLYAGFVPDGRCVVLLTMRADFYQKCAAYPELAARLAEQQFLVSPMDSDGLRQAIEEPAWRVGLEFEAGLVATILDDVNARPGALPLLEHALLELWKLRRGGMLTLEAYRESGKVEGAIAKRADSTYEPLTPEQQAIVRRIMIRLTQFGEGTEDTRRRATMSELITRPDESEAVENVVKEMADARLLTTSKDKQTDERWVDVSHEALIQGWPKLRSWIEDDRAGWRLHRRLTEAAQDWERMGKDESGLYRGAWLAQAIEWREQNERVLNALEREFLDRSLAWQEQEKKDIEDGQRRELEAAEALVQTERKTSKRQVYFLVGLSILFIVVLIAASIARQESATAKEQTAVAEEQRNLASRQAYIAQMILAQQNFDTNNFARTDELLNATIPRAGQKDLRGFEWYRLWRLRSNGLLGHHDLPIALAPDGRTIASSWSGIHLWSLATEQGITLTETNTTARAASAAFAPDGWMLASSNGGSTVRLWNVQVGQEVAALEGDQHDSIRSLAFAPDGQTLASTIDTGFYGIAGRIEEDILHGKSVPFTHTIQLWNVATRQMTTKWYIPDADSLAFAPDGRTLASGGRAIWLWNMLTKQPVATFEGGNSISLAFAPDGRTLASGGYDGIIRLWSVATRKVVATFKGHTSPVISLAFAPDGRTLISGSEDSTIRRWYMATNQTVDSFTKDLGRVVFLDISPNGQTLAFGSDDGTIRLWNATTGQTLTTLKGHTARVNSLSFALDGRTLASGSDDKTIKLWNIVSGEVATLQGHTDSVTSVAFAPDGQMLASGSNDKTIKFWNPASGQETAATAKQAVDIYSVAFAPDGRTLAASGGEKSIRLWNVVTKQMVTTLTGDEDSVSSVAFTPDGQTLASRTYEGVSLWSVVTRQARTIHLRTYVRPNDLVTLAPDGRTLASGGDDGTIRLWNVATMQEVAVLTGHTGRINFLVFAPDGRTLVSGSADNTIRLWRGATDGEVPRVGQE